MNIRKRLPKAIHIQIYSLNVKICAFCKQAAFAYFFQFSHKAQNSISILTSRNEGHRLHGRTTHAQTMCLEGCRSANNDCILVYLFSLCRLYSCFSLEQVRLYDSPLKTSRSKIGLAPCTTRIRSRL